MRRPLGVSPDFLDKLPSDTKPPTTPKSANTGADMANTQNCTGCFLVASPYLSDGHFFRAVVFIVRHTEEGAFGVVINRASERRFSEAVEMSEPSGPHQSKGKLDTLSELAKSKRDLIYIGGPVDGPLLVLHNIAGIGEPCGILDDGQPGTQTVVDDHPAESFGSMSIQWADVPAWMTTDEDHLRLLAHRQDARIKFIVGYSGWGARQLDDELDAGGWLVTPAEADSIFDDGTNLGEIDVWEKLVKRCGHAILKGLRPDLLMPSETDDFDPGLN
jgi:putative transcriptional regulator